MGIENIDALASDMGISPKLESQFATSSDGGYGAMKDSLTGVVTAITNALDKFNPAGGDVVILIYLGGTMLDEGL